MSDEAPWDEPQGPAAEAAAETDVAAEVLPGDPPDPALPGPFAVRKTTPTVGGFACDFYAPTTDAPVPAVVLSPGFMLEKESFGAYGAHLASHGIACLIPTWGDSFINAIPHSTLAEDVRALLDWLAAQPGVDPSRLGAGGHSRGGKVALLAATRDPRIRASFDFDPVDSVAPGTTPSEANPSVTPELIGALTIPLGFLGSAYGGTTLSPLVPACAPSDDNYAAYAAHATTPTLYTWVAPASGHNDFADPLPTLLTLACQAGDDPAATRALARKLVAAFYLATLAGDARYLPALAPLP